jgi:UDP-N-acetyl-D-mannosaminuronic acid transferase (WecB/TagA/CpsF family)
MHEFMIFGNKVTLLTVDYLHREIKSVIEQNRKELILHANVHGIILAKKHKWFKDLRNNAYVVHSDGASVIMGVRVLDFYVLCRITYSNCILELWVL